MSNYYGGTCHPNDDLWPALWYNPQDFDKNTVVDIMAEVPGENDEYHWFWIIELTDGNYVLLDGSCDYTGWDCHSGVDTLGIFPSALEAAQTAPEEDYAKRGIRRNLVAQVAGQQPKFLYVS